MSESKGTSLLQVEGLSVSYGSRLHRTRVLQKLSLSAEPGEIVGVIGETGSGKTTLARAIVGLVPVDGGRIQLDDVDLTAHRSRRARLQLRRSGAVHYLFQDPLRSLDPDLTVGEIIREPLAIASAGDREQQDRVVGALRRVGLPPSLLDRVPGEISGGQRQRVSIARAIVNPPRLLICDEPVSALDASNRNQILRLLDGLRREEPMAILLITHDLSSLAGIADRVVVLHHGRVVEEGPISKVFNHPEHPYTALLVASAPTVRRGRIGTVQLSGSTSA